MKILFAVNAYPPEIGGAEIAAKRIVDILTSKHKVTVLTRKINQKRPKDKENLIETETKSSYAYMPKLKKILNKEKYDLYISFGFGKHFFDEIGKFCKKNELPCIAIFTGGFHTSKNKFFKKFYESFLAKKSLQRYDKIIVATDNEKKYWKENFKVKDKKIIVIPHTLDENYLKFKKTNILKKNNLKNNKYIFYIGRLAKNKRPDILIKAFEKTNLDLKLVISGKDTKSEELTRLTKNKKILFLGNISDDEKKDLMKNCKFYVFPSEYESFGLVVLEAKKFNKPILVSDIWAFRELIKDNKYFFKNNVGSLSTKLIEFSKRSFSAPKIKILNQKKAILKEVKEFEKN